MRLDDLHALKKEAVLLHVKITEIPGNLYLIVARRGKKVLLSQ